MGNHLKVSVPRMKNDGEKLQKGFESIPQMIEKLDVSMAKLAQCWKGPAHSVFREQVEKDITNMLDVYQWMKKFLEAHGEAQKVYGNCEQKTFDCISGIWF